MLLALLLLKGLLSEKLYFDAVDISPKQTNTKFNKDPTIQSHLNLNSLFLKGLLSEKLYFDDVDISTKQTNTKFNKDPTIQNHLNLNPLFLKGLLSEKLYFDAVDISTKQTNTKFNKDPTIQNHLNLNCYYVCRLCFLGSSENVFCVHGNEISFSPRNFEPIQQPLKNSAVTRTHNLPLTSPKPLPFSKTNIFIVISNLQGRIQDFFQVRHWSKIKNRKFPRF